MKYVIDCSSAMKWELPEPDSANAIRLRDEYRNGIHELLAPDIFPAEVGSAALVAERKGRIGPGQFPIIVADILKSCPVLHETARLIPPACRIIASITTGFRMSFYDALYVALAEREGCELVTGDDKLLRNAGGQYPFIISVSALP